MTDDSGSNLDAAGEAEFRATVAEWFASLPDEEFSGDDRSRMVDHRMSAKIVEKCRRWQRRLYDAGFAGITWPAEWGGFGGTAVHDLIFRDEAQRAGMPVNKVFDPSMGMYGPTLLTFGTESQKQKHLRSMLRGDEVWCQLFSEPEAGSDLASVKTRVQRDGDTLRVNGLKSWSSRAQYSDYGMLVARSEDTTPPHRGITCIIVDMRAPGIEVRPIRQMDGGDSFCEVALDGVSLPSDAVIGAWNDGWKVAVRTLMHERFTLGSRGRDGGFGRLVDLAHERRRDGEGSVRERLAEVYTRARLMHYLQLQLESAARRGLEPGPEGSVAKVLYGELMDTSTELAMELLGPWGMLAHDPGEALSSRALAWEDHDGSEDPYGFWQSQLLGRPSVHIAGGTDEIMRNLIGERILGLPREPRPSLDGGR